MVPLEGQDVQPVEYFRDNSLMPQVPKVTYQHTLLLIYLSFLSQKLLWDY